MKLRILQEDNMEYVIGIFAIILISFILHLYIRKRKIVLLVMGILIIATYFIIGQMQYTTFQEVYSDQLNEDTIIEGIYFTVREDESDTNKRRMARITLKNEEEIEKVLNDLSHIKLKKEFDTTPQFDTKYLITIIVTNKVREGVSQTEYISLKLGSDFLNHYLIVSESNHLKTLENLVKNKTVEWTEW